ncbi:unnamed protein product [Cuscuta epithymum]|uniref:Uncharacterized protein n=1 Tax=Cuscuta epithymum TaxID=186058 RepID=A0AAV0D251_9ASTE|nr:unnamed protein product [Cuscuta epithymum]
MTSKNHEEEVSSNFEEANSQTLEEGSSDRAVTLPTKEPTREDEATNVEVTSSPTIDLEHIEVVEEPNVETIEKPIYEVVDEPNVETNDESIVEVNEEPNIVDDVLIEDESEYIIDSLVKDIIDKEEAKDSEDKPNEVTTIDVNENIGNVGNVEPTVETTNGVRVPFDKSNAATLEPPKQPRWGTKPSFVSLFKDNRELNKGMKLMYIEPKNDIIDLSTRVLSSMIDIWGLM